MGEGITGSGGTADIVHNLVDHKQKCRPVKPSRDGSEQTKSHQTIICGVGMHENGPDRPDISPHLPPQRKMREREGTYSKKKERINGTG